MCLYCCTMTYLEQILFGASLGCFSELIPKRVISGSTCHRTSAPALVSSNAAKLTAFSLPGAGFAVETELTHDYYLRRVLLNQKHDTVPAFFMSKFKKQLETSGR